ncbi:MAG: endonuclease [Acidobacteriota bacterium]|nr:endonuclease [Acidobacteriota bacterium]
MKTLFSILLISISIQVSAQPGDYYDSVNTTSPAALWLSLHDLIDDHIRFPYTSSTTDTWDILEMADEDPTNSANIIDLYKNASYPKQGGGNNFYNREHVWPSSYGFPNDVVSNYPYTDCHHLFLCDSGYNSSRSNKPFRYCSETCDEKPTEANDGRGGGSGTYPGNSNWTSGSLSFGTWETWDGRKGDVARAIFYMAIRYEGGVHGDSGADEPDLRLTDDDGVIDLFKSDGNVDISYMGIRSDLLRWHEQDPVDDRERRRNDVIFSFQGNRNPFIDHPEWVPMLFADRWVAHVTRLGGDFQATLTVTNPGSQAGRLDLHPYDIMGNPLNPEMLDIPEGGHLQMTSEDLFPGLDISHLRINGTPSCVVTLGYRGKTGGGTAHVLETRSVGTRFILYQGEWDTVWDGMAIVNVGEGPAVIEGVQVDSAGNEVFRATISPDLAVNGKTLTNFVTFFPDNPGHRIMIESSQPAVVVFLRGSLGAEPFLYQTEPILIR